MSSISNSVSAVAAEFMGARRLQMSNALGRLQKKSSAMRVLVLVALFAVTALLDLVLALRKRNVARSARELNQSVYEEAAPERFVTLFFGVLDTSSLTFDYVSAGHNPPLFFRKWTLSRQSSNAEMLEKDQFGEERLRSTISRRPKRNNETGTETSYGRD